MKRLGLYTAAAVGMVMLALAEQDQHMGVSGFLAIFLCQPWLAAIWVLVAFGVPIPDTALTPTVIAGMAAANVLLWGTYLGWTRRRGDAP